MFIETTFMRYGKGPGGLIGLTLKEKSVKNWENSHHICTQILTDLNEMRCRDTLNEHRTHKKKCDRELELMKMIAVKYKKN